MGHQKLAYIHALRGIAMLIVVAAHCFAATFSDEITGIATHSCHYLMKNLFRHINLLFIFISGFLFQTLSYKYQFGDYISKKIKYVVIPYTLISLPALFIYMLDVKTDHYSFGDIYQYDKIELFFLLFFTGTALGPLWFIPMMILFFLISPMLISLDRKPVFYYLIIPLLFLSLYVGRSDFNANPLQNFVFYMPVYLLGMLSSRYKENLILPLATHMIAINALWILAIFVPPYIKGIDSIIFLSKLCFCYGVLGFVLRYPSFQHSPMLSAIADKSFGIFFVHGYLVYGIKLMLDKHSVYVQGMNSYVLFMLIFVGVSLCSVLIVHIIQKLNPRYSRLIIGS